MQPTTHAARDMLTALIQRDGCTQRTVAEDLGVHHITVHRWLHGAEIPVVARMAVAYLATHKESLQVGGDPCS